jgi:glycosyltransferase involved in cell wall biosynthesis
MRIAFVATSTGTGGAEMQVLSLADRMRSRGHLTLIVSMIPVGAVGDEARRLGIPVETLGMRPGLPDPRGLLRLAAVLRRWKPDVVHSHMVHANILARLVRPLAPVPALVSTVHNSYEGGALRMAAYRLTDSLADLNTIISRAAAERYLRLKAVSPGKLRVVPNGVDLDRFRSDPDARERVRRELGLGEEFAWLAVGRFEAAKDYPNLFHAFADAAAGPASSVLLLAGQGALREETEALAGRIGIASRARFLGVRHDVPALMAAADGYVMSSAWEGLPMVLLEAAAVGLPVVATQVGGNDEVVRPGVNGFLVPARDASALARAMRELVSLPPERRRQLAEQGRAHVQEHYALGGVLDRWETIYRELGALTRRPAGRDSSRSS